jgi:DNA gyrase subunit A
MADGDQNTLDAALHGNIEERELEKEMRSSYLDYAMSVIVGRALPDVRDGLKPVHRRVLYAMHDLGLQPNRAYRKCAFIVGEVMGKYHPHGDSAIYETLVRMAQDFALRYPLVDGQGNFGSIDDDPPAAMRYTEARLGPLATEMLRDIDADTVDFGPNYDESTREPVLLPARFPNLLVNGATGIAVGMATNIPPHNLREVIGAVNAYIDDPEVDMNGLMKHVKGPDFPGGGTIMGKQGIKDAYRSGRGSVKVRAKAHVEPLKGGKDAIVVTELPFMVKKGGEGGLIAKIADLVRDKKINGISDLRDESDRTGMRLVIELKRGGDPAQVVLNQLYKRTAMQQSFGINMVALVDGVPKTLSLRELVEQYVGHQKEVITRRTQHQLARAEARAHILEGLLIALKNLDAVIKLIRGSKDPDTARDGLIKKFKLSRAQAQAILDMRLQRLTALEADKIREEHKELTKLIKELRAILADEKKVLGLVKTELNEIGERYGDDRRTEITASDGELDIEDVIADQQMVVSITASGYAKRTPLATYRQQRRGGRGVMGMNMKEGDYIEHLHVCSTHDYLLFFTNQGKVYRTKVYELPEGSRASRGRALANFLPLKEKEKVMSVIPTRDFSEGKFLVFATSQGMVKKTAFKDYDTPIRADGIIAINIKKGDELVRVRMSSGKDDLMMVSKSGHAIRFNEKLARPMGRGTAGVKGMNVAAKDNEVLSLDVVDKADKQGELLVVTENGYGKRTSISEYPIKGRGGKGVLTAKLTAKKGGLAGARVVREGQELIFISQTGMVQRNAVEGISRMGRPTQGVRVMNLKKGDRVSAVALVVESENGNGNGNGAGATGAPVEDELPTAENVAEEAAAAEAAGNGEAKVTKSSGSTATAPKAKPKPARSRAKAAKPKAKPAAKPAPKKRSSGGSAAAAKPKSAKPKVKPKHTATAKQRAESERKKKR